MAEKIQLTVWVKNMLLGTGIMTALLLVGGYIVPTAQEELRQQRHAQVAASGPHILDEQKTQELTRPAINKTE
jgi:hypothetical protein